MRRVLANLLLFSLALVLVATVMGCSAPAETPRPVDAPENSPAGKWRRARVAEPPAGDELDERSEALMAVPYLQGYRSAGASSGVTIFDSSRALDGWNLVLSGHAPEADLIAMDGRPIHRWRYELEDFVPELYRDPAIRRLEYFRRARVLEDGSLLAIYEGLGLIKLDRESNLVWSYRGGAHHDLDLDEEGRIWLLDREGKLLPRLHPTDGVLEDFVTVLSADGAVERRISILEAFENSEFADLLTRMPTSGDILHTNTLERLDGRFADRHPAFKAGNLLISVLMLDTVAILDPTTETIVWALTGPWRKQHQPTFLDNGNLLLFDNLGASSPGREVTRVIEFDPLDFPQTEAFAWDYTVGPEFYSKTLGSASRLTNGNTLITESENGRAFEVTTEGEIVWEYHNPRRAGESEELVAVLFEAVRLDPRDVAFESPGG